MISEQEFVVIESKIGPDLRPSSKRKYFAILDAAREHFLERGFNDASVDAIADSAQVSKRTVYKHFEDKQALFSAVINWLCRDVPPPNFDLIIKDSASDPVSVLTRLGEHILTHIYTKEQVELFRVVTADARRFPEIGRVMFKQISITERCVDTYLRELQDKGVIRLPCADIAASQFLGLLKTDLQERLLFGDRRRVSKREVSAAAECCARVFMHGCMIGGS